MATNNKHPGNHSGTGSDSHVTGRQVFFFFSGGGVRKLVSSPPPHPGVISSPLSFPHLELDGGKRGSWEGAHPHCSVRSWSQG